MNDTIVCCNVCRAPNGAPVPLVATQGGNCWCPQCGKQWEEIKSECEIPVSPEEKA